MDKLKAVPKSFQKTIHRDEIISYAKEKGFYVDPTALTEKQKKDAKYMESIVGMTELNSKVLAKAFSQMITEADLQKRKVKNNSLKMEFWLIFFLKAKKDKLEGKEPPPDKKKDEKKAPEKEKKGPAKNALPEEKKEEEKQQPEKEYNKAFDILYILLDYPKTLVQ